MNPPLSNAWLGSINHSQASMMVDKATEKSGLPINHLGCIMIEPSEDFAGSGESREFTVRLFSTDKEKKHRLLMEQNFVNRVEAMHFFKSIDGVLDERAGTPEKLAVSKDRFFEEPKDASRNGTTYLGSVARKGVLVDLYSSRESDGARIPVAVMQYGSSDRTHKVAFRSNDPENHFASVARRLEVERGLVSRDFGAYGIGD